MVPTPAGVVLDERARHLLDAADGVVREVRLAAGAPLTIRIGAFSTAAQFLLPPVLTSVLTAMPDLELVLIDREPPDGFTDVVAGRLDVMITHLYTGNDVSVPNELVIEPLVRDDLVLLVPTDHWATDGIRLADLAGERWVSGPPDTQNHVALAWASGEAGFTPQVAFETTDYAVTMTLVANGLGPAFVPRLILGSAPDGVRSIALADAPDLHRMISIVHRETVRNETMAFVLAELRGQGRSAGKMTA